MLWTRLALVVVGVVVVGAVEEKEGVGAESAGEAEVQVEVVARCWVHSLTAHCHQIIGGLPETKKALEDFSACCDRACEGKRMYGKRRVYTPAWMDEWWRKQSKDCLCCLQPVSSFAVPIGVPSLGAIMSVYALSSALSSWSFVKA